MKIFIPFPTRYPVLILTFKLILAKKLDRMGNKRCVLKQFENDGRRKLQMERSIERKKQRGTNLGNSPKCELITTEPRVSRCFLFLQRQDCQDVKHLDWTLPHCALNSKAVCVILSMCFQWICSSLKIALQIAKQYSNVVTQPGRMCQTANAGAPFKWLSDRQNMTSSFHFLPGISWQWAV